MILINKSVVFSFGFGILFTAMATSCGSNTDTKSTTASTDPTAETVSATSGKIAYVNLDTLEEKYDFFKKKKAELEKRQSDMEAEVERLGKNLQSEYLSFQKKAQSGTLTQAEGQAAEKRLAKLQQNVEAKRQSLAEQLMKEQDAFNKELKKRLDDFLAKYNEDKRFDYILTYIEGGMILYANEALDITDDVIKGMNADSKTKKSDSAVTTP